MTYCMTTIIVNKSNVLKMELFVLEMDNFSNFLTRKNFIEKIKAQPKTIL